MGEITGSIICPSAQLEFKGSSLDPVVRFLMEENPRGEYLIHYYGGCDRVVDMEEPFCQILNTNLSDSDSAHIPRMSAYTACVGNFYPEYDVIIVTLRLNAKRIRHVYSLFVSGSHNRPVKFQEIRELAERLNIDVGPMTY